MQCKVTRKKSSALPNTVGSNNAKNQTSSRAMVVVLVSEGVEIIVVLVTVVCVVVRNLDVKRLLLQQLLSSWEFEPISFKTRIIPTGTHHTEVEFYLHKGFLLSRFQIKHVSPASHDFIYYRDSFPVYSVVLPT